MLDRRELMSLAGSSVRGVALSRALAVWRMRRQVAWVLEMAVRRVERVKLFESFRALHRLAALAPPRRHLRRRRKKRHPSV